MKRSAEAAQSDPELVGSFGIVAFKDGEAVDQDLPDGRVQHRRERLSGAVFAGDARWARLLGFGAVVLLAQHKSIAAFGLAAGAWLEFMPGEQLFGGDQETLGAASLQLEFRLAQVLALVAGAHLAVVHGEFDLAALYLDVAGGALDNGFEYWSQRGVGEGLLHGATDLLVGDLPYVWPFFLNKGLQFDRVRNATLHVLIDLYPLLPAPILAAQPKRDAGGAQVMPRSVEVDGPEFLGCGRADG